MVSTKDRKSKIYTLFCHQWQPTPVLLPGESQGWGAWWAAVYGVAQSQTRLKWLSSSSRRKWQPTPVFLPGESQGRGSWWAAVYGVAQGRTGLKPLSSSSSCHQSLRFWEIFANWKQREGPDYKIKNTTASTLKTKRKIMSPYSLTSLEEKVKR